jgi:hypothetical protein
MKETRKEVEKYLGTRRKPNWEEIEEGHFKKSGIEHPYYLRGKYKAKAIVKLLNLAEKMLDAAKNFVLTKVP